MKIYEYRIKSLGLDHPDYVCGAGIVGTTWDDAVLGCGDSEAAAYEDALQSLAEQGWDISDLPSAADAGMDSEDVVPVDSEEFYYVAIYVREDEAASLLSGGGV